MMTHNPPPRWGKEAVTPLAIEYLRARAAEGERKYGMPLMTENGRDADLDVLEELADAFQYQFQKCREKGIV